MEYAKEERKSKIRNERNRKVRMQNRRRTLILCMMAVLCAAAVTGCGTKNVKDSDVVMEICGQPVVKAEYQMILNRYVAQVKGEYTTEEANRKDFWSMESENGTPLGRIMELAKEELLHKKAVASLAKEAGIEQETDYLSISRQLEQENDRRGEKSTSESTVYGLTTYTPDDYYSYCYTNAEGELLEYLKQKHPLTDAELKKIYQENIEDYTSEIYVKSLAAEIPIDSGMEQAAQIAADMEQETETEVLSKKYPDAGFYEIEMSSLNTQEGKSGVYAQRWLWASSMQQGEVCEPFQVGENIMVLRCLNREEPFAEPFENIKGVLKDQVQTELAQEDIEEEEKNASIICEEDVLEQAALEVLEQ